MLNRRPVDAAAAVGMDQIAGFGLAMATQVVAQLADLDASGAGA